MCILYVTYYAFTINWYIIVLRSACLLVQNPNVYPWQSSRISCVHVSGHERYHCCRGTKPGWRSGAIIWGLVCLKQASRTCINNCIPQILGDVITYACPRDLYLAPKSSYHYYIQMDLSILWCKRTTYFQISLCIIILMTLQKPAVTALAMELL